MSSAVAWARIIRAGWRKNWRLTTTYPSWVLNRLLGPLVAVALTVYAYTGLVDRATIDQAFRNAGEAGSFTGFLILGQTIFAFFTGINWRGGMAIQRERWTGTFEMILLAPASRVAWILAESMFGLVDSGWTVFLSMILAGMLFGVGFHVADPLAVVLIIVATLGAMVALGLFFAGFYVLTRAAGPLSQAVSAPLGFLSGTQFPVSALPSAAQAVSYALPVTFGLLGVRRALLGGATVQDLAPYLLPLLGMTAFFSITGVVLLRRMEARAKRTGSIHAY